METCSDENEVQRTKTEDGLAGSPGLYRQIECTAAEMQWSKLGRQENALWSGGAKRRNKSF